MASSILASGIDPHFERIGQQPLERFGGMLPGTVLPAQTFKGAIGGITSILSISLALILNFLL